MKLKGSVTIFCCVSLTIWIACIGVLLELSRVRGMVNHLDRTAASAMESVMADYNQVMMEDYNIFVLDYGKGNENRKETLLRWKTYLKKEVDEAMGNLLYQLLFDESWFSLKQFTFNIDKTWSLLDQEGELFANQVVQYMKYKEVGNIVSILLEQVNVIQKGMEGQEALTDSWKADSKADLIEPMEEHNKSLYVKKMSYDNVSGEKISKSDLPSTLQGIQNEEVGKRPIWNNISEEVLIGEYILEHFTSYQDVDESGEKMVCQQEYILYGKQSDQENMKCVSDMLLVVRCGLNLIALLSSESMQATVEATAITISSALLNPELAPIFQIALNCIWVYMESERDVERLLKGEKVPFLKEESQWLETILKLGQEGEVDESLDSVKDTLEDVEVVDELREELKEIGTTKKELYSMDMSYEDYMRIFLLFLTPKVKYYRAMDMIQIGVQSKNPNFKIVNCIGGMQATVYANGNEKFLMFIPWKKKERYQFMRTVSFVY